MSPPKSVDDAFLRTLESARNGDAEALELLFQRFYPRVQRMVHLGLSRDLRTTRPWLLARFSTGDVVQDVFRSLLHSTGVNGLTGFHGQTEDAFSGYLAMVVRNRLLDAIRFHEAAQRDGRRSKPDPELARPESQQPDPAEQAASAEQLDQFQTALATFSEREQLLLRARMEQSSSFDDLAEQLGYGSKDSARRAFYAAQAQLAILLRKNLED